MKACKHRLAIIAPGIEHLIDCTRWHDDGEHHGKLVETKIVWQSGDRRDFTGKYVACGDRGCWLPSGHPGAHVRS